MALTQKSSFLYGLQVTSYNSSIDFQAASGGPTLQATIQLGYYSLTDLLNAIAAAMAAVDFANTYTVTANRSLSGGTQNRVTIATSGSYLSLKFGTGPRAATSVNALIGFPGMDQTGHTSYSGTQSAGTLLIPTWYAYNYLDLNQYKQVFGNLNISATGQKEAIVFQIQQFFEMQFKYESSSMILNAWSPFMTWAIQQKAFDFTPDITNANTVYNATLESTDEDSKGLGYKFTEMLPDFPFLYDTGTLKLRLKVGS